MRDITVDALKDYRIGRNKTNGKSTADHRVNVEDIADVIYVRRRRLRKKSFFSKEKKNCFVMIVIINVLIVMNLPSQMNNNIS